MKKIALAALAALAPIALAAQDDIDVPVVPTTSAQSYDSAFYLFADYFDYEFEDPVFGKGSPDFDGNLVGFTLGLVAVERLNFEFSYRTGDGELHGNDEEAYPNDVWNYDMESERTEYELRMAYKWDHVSIGLGGSWIDESIDLMIVDTDPTPTTIVDSEYDQAFYSLFIDMALYRVTRLSDNFFVTPKITGTLGIEWEDVDDVSEAEGSNYYKLDGVLQFFYVSGQSTFSVEGGYRYQTYFDDESAYGGIKGLYVRGGYKYSW